jgi:PilZ domain
MNVFRRLGGSTRVQASEQTVSMPLAAAGVAARDRREHRRHDVEQKGISVERWDGRRGADVIGRIVDISAGGVRIRTSQSGLRADNQVRVRLELPSYAGISPFIDTAGGQAQPKQEWVGWMAVCRVTETSDGEVEVAGRLLDMEDMDRGMLGLYLSTQPIAA